MTTPPPGCLFSLHLGSRLSSGLLESLIGHAGTILCLSGMSGLV